MGRFLGILVWAVACSLTVMGVAGADEPTTWPIFPLPPDWRGPGFYFSLPKLLAVWLLILVWVRTTTWINTDCEENGLDHRHWNAILLGSFAGALVLMLMVPWFWCGFSLLVVSYAGPLVAFLRYRDSRVGEDDRGLVVRRLRRLMVRGLRAVGIQIDERARVRALETASAVRLTPRGGDGVDLGQRLQDAERTPGFRDIQKLTEDAMKLRAEAIMLDGTTENGAVHYLVDGVWSEVASPDRQGIDAAVESIRVLCGLSPQAASPREAGAFAVSCQGKAIAGELSVQGAQGGRRAALQFRGPRTKFGSLDELGMPATIQEQLLDVLAQPKGLILFSGPPGSGVRTTVNAVLRSTDRFTRDFASFENEADRQETVENVPVTTCRADGPEKPDKTLLHLIRTEPQVIAVRSPFDQEMAGLICPYAVNSLLFLGTIRATSAADTLLRFLSLKVPPADFAPAITAVLNQRLIRRLCPECKEAHSLPPETLRQFNLPPGETPSLFRSPTPPPPAASAKRNVLRREHVCSACGGLGYVGRSAIFEFMVVDRTIRKILQMGPQADLIAQAAQRAGMRSLQAEGLTWVAQGVTSLAELTRALK